MKFKKEKSIHREEIPNHAPKESSHLNQNTNQCQSFTLELRRKKKERRRS
jgi:hypothetical protein